MFQARGVIPPLVTPLDADGELLDTALRSLVDYTIDNGVHGVFVLGSAGEIYGLSDAQKRRVVEITVEHVAGRVPVYAGASEITTRDCIATARMAQSVGGVSALSVLTPYFMTPNQSELTTHFTGIAAATDLPVLLYSNPGRTNVPITVETMQALARVENIVGIKDSSGDLELTARYLSEAPPGFATLIGKDTLIYEGLRRGASGAIASTANIAPRLVSEIFNAFDAGDLTRAAALQERLVPLRHLVDTATFPVALKKGLQIAGVDAGLCLAPAREMATADHARLTELVDQLVNAPDLGTPVHA